MSSNPFSREEEPDDAVETRFIEIALDELARLLDELRGRLARGMYLPAISTVEGITARGSEVGQCCASQLRRELAPLARADDAEPVVGLYL